MYFFDEQHYEVALQGPSTCRVRFLKAWNLFSLKYTTLKRCLFPEKYAPSSDNFDPKVRYFLSVIFSSKFCLRITAKPITVAVFICFGRKCFSNIALLQTSKRRYVIENEHQKTMIEICIQIKKIKIEEIIEQY